MTLNDRERLQSMRIDGSGVIATSASTEMDWAHAFVVNESRSRRVQGFTSSFLIHLT
jgi:hypothetical protein